LIVVSLNSGLISLRAGLFRVKERAIHVSGARRYFENSGVFQGINRA
tara:strand:- start:3844 stop:3984 length:141 start_codon:yes stop_codon:yes gene_type:complete